MSAALPSRTIVFMAMNRSIDLNADLGEGNGNDDLLIPLVSSVNIACGGHAGDADTMHRAISSALRADVAIGAHPGYEDRKNFGRIPLTLEPSALRDSLVTQLERFRQIAHSCGAVPHHVKPHGALYHQANQDPVLAALFVDCVRQILPCCHMYGPPHGALATATTAAGLRIIAEGFADRRYQDDGGLVSRQETGAVLFNPDEAARQAVEIASLGQVTTRSGTTITLPAQTLCIHGDSHHAHAILHAIRKHLQHAGISIERPSLGNQQFD